MQYIRSEMIVTAFYSMLSVVYLKNKIPRVYAFNVFRAHWLRQRNETLW